MDKRTGMQRILLPLLVAVITTSFFFSTLYRFGVADTMAKYDVFLMAIAIGMSVVGILPTFRRGDFSNLHWFSSLEISSVPSLIAGCLVLVGVFVRQWVQMSSPIEIDLAMVANVSSRIRYAVVLNISYLCGWVLILWAVRPQIAYQEWWQTHRREVLPVMVLMGIAAVMRLVWLNEYPNIINGDEGLIGWWARTMFAETGPLAFTLTAMDGVGTFYLTILRGLISLFGSEVWVLRIMPALAGTASIGSIYLLARQVYGVRVGLLSAVLLTFAHTHIHFSRQIAVSYIYAAFFLPIVLWALWQMVATRRAWPAVLAGFLLTMHANFYVDAWAWAVLTVLILAAWSIVDRATIVHAAPAIGLFVGTAVLGFGPQLVWAAVLPQEFFSRLTSDGSFVSGWIYQEAVNNNVSVVQFVLYLYQVAFEAILTSPFIDFYHADVPILDMFSALLFGIGVVIVHRHIRTRRSLLILGWFWGGMTALAVFTLPVSTYHYRLFVIVPVLMVFCAIGLDWLWSLVARRVPQRVAMVLVSVLVVTIGIINVHVYVTRLALDCRYGGDHQTQRAGAAARFLKEQNIHDAEVVIVGQLNDLHAGTWKSFEYLNETLHFSNAYPDASYDFTPLRGQDVYILYIPERVNEMPTIEANVRQIKEYEPIMMCGQLYGYLTHVRVP